MVLRETTEQPDVDTLLLEKFSSEIKSSLPHLNDEGLRSTVVNGTPLIDLTDDLIECGRVEYHLDISRKDLRVLGKLESGIRGGSVKVRPAVRIIEDAIISGKLRRQQTIFEATSGNFGIALGMMRNLGFDVVALVSRKLQDGVLEELENAGVKTVYLDIDLCPAPESGVNTSTFAAKVATSSVREQFARYGLGLSVFDDSRGEIEKLLARGDAIGLAKFLAEIYGGFCPEQYDNELNVRAHENWTGPEIDQQLCGMGDSLADFEVVCAFGTGGTSGGLSRYMGQKFGRKSVHVVFPLSNQDVAGIRTKEKAHGLRFYEPGRYAGVHEVDFDAAAPALRFFISRGYDIGESSALALYAILQMVNYGAGRKFIVILADGIQKYRKSAETKLEARRSDEVTARVASSNLADYGGVLWTHPVFVPSKAGVRLIASSLGCDESEVRVARTGDVEKFYANQEMTEDIRRLLPVDGRKLLLVCMSGATSLRLAVLLAERGIRAESLTGGIEGLRAIGGEETTEVVELARE